MLCGVPYSKQLEINDWTHLNGVHFIAAETRGLFGYLSVPCIIQTTFTSTFSAPSSMISVLNLLAWILLESNL